MTVMELIEKLRKIDEDDIEVVIERDKDVLLY